jgi:hypothetical protein
MHFFFSKKLLYFTQVKTIAHTQYVGASINVFYNIQNIMQGIFPSPPMIKKYYEMANDRGTMNIIKDVGDDGGIG